MRYPPARPVLGFPTADLVGADYSGELPTTCVPATFHIHERVYSISASQRVRGPISETPTLSPLAAFLSRQPSWIRSLVQGATLVDGRCASFWGTLPILHLVEGQSSTNVFGFSWRLMGGGSTAATCTFSGSKFPLSGSRNRATRLSICSGLAFASVIQDFVRLRLQGTTGTPVQVGNLSRHDTRWLRHAINARNYSPTHLCAEDADVACVVRWACAKNRVITQGTTSEDRGANTDAARRLRAAGQRLQDLVGQGLVADQRANHREAADVWHPVQVDVVHATTGILTGPLLATCRQICCDGWVGDYFRRRYSWDQAVWDSIDVRNAGIALGKYYFNDRVRLTKLRTG